MIGHAHVKQYACQSIRHRLSRITRYVTVFPTPSERARQVLTQTAMLADMRHVGGQALLTEDFISRPPRAGLLPGIRHIFGSGVKPIAQSERLGI